MDIVEQIRLALVERQDVRLAYRLGSAAAHTAPRGSDTDIAVLFDEVPTRGVLDLLTERLAAVIE